MIACLINYNSARSELADGNASTKRSQRGAYKLSLTIINILASFCRIGRRNRLTATAGLKTISSTNLKQGDEFSMSAIGTKRTSLVSPHMSAIGGKADMTVCIAFFLILIKFKKGWRERSPAEAGRR